MRKFLLTSCILTSIGISGGLAQIVITSADMPAPVNMIVSANDTMPTISIGNTDTMQSWDMTALVQHTMDTSIVLNYSDHPDASFSSANTVILQKGVQDFYGYLVNSSTGFELIGGNGIIDIQGTSTPVRQTYTPGDKLFNFPSSYDSSYVNNYVSDAKFYFGHTIQGFQIDSIHRWSTVQKTVHVDAWGTLTTPMGGPYNVLRVKEVSQTNDTAMAYFFGDWNNVPGGITSSVTTTYYWWANGMGNALVTAVMDTNGTDVASVQWLYELPSTPPVMASATATNASCGDQCDGTATATASLGTAPYSYSWNSYPVQTTATATGLCPGTYTVIVTDSLSDSTMAIVTVGAPAAPVITASGVVLHASSGSSYQWFLNDTLISGATSASYTVTQNGSYTVIVTTSGCTDTSVAYNYTTIGIHEAEMSNRISVYPNPATSQVTITFDNMAGTSFIKDPAIIDIRNQLGESVKKIELSQLSADKKIQIDISSLPRGTYFVSIKNNTAIINKKFVKQ
jgi:hypothetical protein